MHTARILHHSICLIHTQPVSYITISVSFWRKQDSLDLHHLSSMAQTKNIFSQLWNFDMMYESRRDQLEENEYWGEPEEAMLLCIKNWDAPEKAMLLYIRKCHNGNPM